MMHKSEANNLSHNQHQFFNKTKKRPAPLVTEGEISPKALERLYSPKSARTVFDYRDNLSAALSLSVEDAALNENLHNINNLIEMSKMNIVEHAARRVDLFFYTLVAYYHSNIVPELGWTKLQHGRGRHALDGSTVTQACHSSFTPSLIDETLGKKIPLESKEDNNLTYKTSLVCSTHFMDSQASTLELPYFVNEFDAELEENYHCRKRALSIIANVAKGVMTPVQGLHVFLVMMQDTFAKMVESKHFYKSLDRSPSTKDSIESKLKLLELVKEGTLKEKWNDDTKSINDPYVFMLLRLNTQEIKACLVSDANREKIINQKYDDMQKEIQSTPSEHVRMSKM